MSRQLAAVGVTYRMSFTSALPPAVVPRVNVHPHRSRASFTAPFSAVSHASRVEVFETLAIPHEGSRVSSRALRHGHAWRSVGAGRSGGMRSIVRARATRVNVSPARQAVTRPSPSTDAGAVLGPLDAPSLACGRRRAAVPYYNGPVGRPVFVNDVARDAIEAANARDFIALPRADDAAVLRLREAMEKGWTKNEAYGSGHAGMWPEVFEAGAELVKAQFPQFGDVEVLSGTGWLEPELRDDAIDWVVRRPEGHVVSSKIHFATRLHRDPDSWTNPRTPQRPKDGWTALSMPDRDRYQYRFVNVWVARSAIDPTGQVWQSPLVVCLPREGGKREWPFERRKLSMDVTEAEREFNVQGVNPIDPKTWIPGVNRLFRPLWNKDAGKKGKSTSGDGFGGGEEAATAEEMEAFEFPELTPDDAHTFVTGPVMVFDSFDLWHGAATWEESDEDKKRLSDTDTKGRQPFHRARCSIEMRFRVRIDMQAAREAEANGGEEIKWGPFSAAVASGKFRGDGLRDSEAAYDLKEGCMIR